MALVLFLLFSHLFHLQEALRIAYNPIEKIAKFESIDPLKYVMAYLLRDGHFDDLSRLLRYPIYDLRPLYELKVCRHLKPATVQMIIESDMHRKSKSDLLSGVCLITSNVLSKLPPPFAFLLPVNPLSAANWELKSIPVPFFEELLRRSFNEATINPEEAVIYSRAFRSFQPAHFNSKVFTEHAWRMICPKSFSFADKAAQEWIVDNLIANIPVVTRETAKEGWLDLLLRMMTLKMIHLTLKELHTEHASELYSRISHFLHSIYSHLDQMARPEDELVSKYWDLCIGVSLFSYVEVKDFVSAVLPHLDRKSFTADWMVGILTVLRGSEAAFLEFITIVLDWRHMRPFLVDEISLFMKQKFNDSRFYLINSKKRSLSERLKVTRSLSLPVGGHKQFIFIPRLADASCAPFERLSAIWSSLRKVEYSRSNAFQFIQFGYWQQEGYRAVRDIRVFLLQMQQEFLNVPEMFIYEEYLIPSPLCPPSLWEIMAAVLHQNALYLQKPLFTIDKRYFVAALSEDRSTLSSMFDLQVIEQIVPIYAGLHAKAVVFAEIEEGRKGSNEGFFHEFDQNTVQQDATICASERLRLYGLFLRSASKFASALRQVFKSDEYSAEEVYQILHKL